MNKQALLVVTLLTAACSASSPAPDTPSLNPQFLALREPREAPGEIQSVSSAVVRLQDRDASGTGFFINGEGLLVTNNHVEGIENCPRAGCYVTMTTDYEVGKNYSRRRVFLSPKSVSPDLDVAFFQVYQTDADGIKRTDRLKSPSFLEFESKTAEALIGTHINVIGHPRSAVKKWSSGNVLASNTNWFETDAFILPGSSGSPILNDAGKVVGIVHRGVSDASSLTRSGYEALSIGTASAAILEKLGDLENPANIEKFVSLADFTTREKIVANESLFYANASTGYVKIDNNEIHFSDLLGQTCDESLKKTSFSSPDDLRATLRSCAVAVSWMNCFDTSKNKTFKKCDSTKHDAWIARFDTAAERIGNFKASVNPFNWKVYYRAQLESKSSYYESYSTYAGSFLKVYKPALDFDLAQLLAFAGIDEYADQNIPDYLKTYRSKPLYARQAVSIADAFVSLYDFQKMTRDEVLSGIAGLIEDDNLSLVSRLQAQSIHYEFAHDTQK